MVKILRKSRGSISNIKCFIGQKSIFRHSFIPIVEFIFKYTIIITNVSPILASLYQKSLEQFKKISSSMLGKVKKI